MLKLKQLLNSVKKENYMPALPEKLNKKTVSNHPLVKENLPTIKGVFQTSFATPELVKEQFQAVKLHFSSKNYNYNKYNGKVKRSNYKDIVPYTMIAKGKYKTDFPDFFIPGLFQNPKSNIENFLTEDYILTWKYWESYQRAPDYFFERELLEIQNYLEKK